MASDLNSVTIIGRLVREAELKSLPSGSYVSKFSLAVNETQYVKDGENKEHVSFVDCILFGKGAEIFCKYAQKGKRIGVIGRLRQSRWENAEGKAMSRIEIMVDHFQFLDSKGAGENAGHIDDKAMDEQASKQNFAEPFNDDIPF